MVHCADHESCLGKIHEKLDEIKELMCGGKDTIGIAEQLRIAFKRIDRLEEKLDAAEQVVRKGIWTIVGRFLPWLIAAALGGMKLSDMLSIP